MKQKELLNIDMLDLDKDFLLAEEITDKAEPLDILQIVNNLLYNLLDLTRYDIETEEEEKDFKELEEIKDKILYIKNKYIN